MYRVSKRRLITATLAIVTAPCAALLGAVQASAMPTQHTSAVVQATNHAQHVGYANCTYVVTWGTAGVWEKPTKSSHLLKHKHHGDHVHGYSNLTYYNGTEHVYYRAVDTKTARDGIGWMNAGALRLVHC